MEGKDQAGNEITDLNGTFGFQVIASGNPPVLTITEPLDLSYISADSVDFKGTVEAEGGFDSLTATVTITRMSGGTVVRTAEPQFFTIVPSDSSPNWAFTLDTATGITPADGLCMATVTLKATDLKNTITEQKLRLYIDHQAPTATITKVTPYYGYDSGTGKYTVNGTVDVTLSMTDNDQLVSLAYTIGTIVTQPEITVSTPVDNRTLSVNTSSILVPANLPVTAVLRDRAGNEATVDLSNIIRIDQDTDRPTIELTNPLSLAADEAGARDNLITGPSITGNVADDDGVFSLQLTIYDTDVNVNPVATKLFTAGEMGGAAIRKSFSYTFPSEFKDGIYRMTLVAYDINTSPIASKTTEGWFSYDDNLPRIDSWVTEPVGVDVINAPFKLSVTGSDDYALKETDSIIVYQSFNGGTAEPLDHADLTPNGTNTSCDWVAENLPRNLTSPGDPAPVGEYTYKVTVYDWLNNSTTKETVTVQYDTANPVVTAVTFPAETGVNNYVTGSTDFRGTASDEGTGVAKVECSLDGTTWEEATGDKNWSINPSLLNLAAEGAKTLYVRATDAVGNTSDIITRPFVYDNSTPSLTIADTAPTLTKNGFSLSGSAADGYQLRASNSVVITQQLGNGDKLPIDVTPVLAGDSKSCTWTFENLPNLPRIPEPGSTGTTVPFDGTRDGTYKYEITVYDAAGQKSDPETITVQLDSSAPTVTAITSPSAGGVVGTNTSFSGEAADPDGSGVREVRFSVDDGLTWTVAGGNINWQASYSFASDVAEGIKTLRVEAEDTAGNVGSELTRSFVFDRADPTLAITRDVLGVNELSRDGVFDLDGKAIDTHGIVSIVVLQDDVAVPGDKSIAPSATPGEYTWKAEGLPRDPENMSNSLAKDGTYTYKIYAVDAAGKLSFVDTVTVTIDTTAPETNTIAKPEAGATGVMALSDATYLFRGNAIDTGVGVAKIWYQITKSSTASVIPEGASPKDHGYTELVTGGGWNFTRDLVDYTLTPAGGELSEGTGYYLHVLAEDKAGNRSAATSVEFDVDLDDPEVTEDVINTTTIENRRVGFELGGAATDSHGIDTVTITQSFNSEEAIEITGGLDLTPDGTGFDWTLADLPRGNSAGTIGVQALVDGTYEYQITTTDLVGKTHTIVRRIRFDSTGPDIEFTAPAEGGWSSNTTVTVKGLATDLTAVGGVYYSTADSAPDIPDAPDADADWTDLGWFPAGGSFGSWEIELPGLPEGRYGVWVSAMDINGNTTVVDTARTFGVDTARPQLVDSSVAEANENTLFTLTGTVSDTNELHPEDTVTITQMKDGVEVDLSGYISFVDNPLGSGESFTWTLANLPRNPVSLGSSAALDGSADGEYEYTITATDIAGKTKEVTRTVRIDTRNPVLTVAESVETSLSDWINTASFSLSGEITDTDPSSGIRKVEYTHINSELVSTTQTLSVNGINWTGNLPLSNGENQQLTITATDYAGNTDSETYTFDVDLSSPTLTKLTPTGQLLTNLESPIVSTFSVTDEGASGVASVLVTRIGSNSIDVDDQTSSPSGGIWTISVPPTTLAELTLGATEVVTVTATDGAGNSSISTFQISVDTEDPDVLTISSPGDGATINKVTEIRGTASDAVMLDTVDLYIEEGPGTGTYPATSTAHFTGGSAYNWSYDFDTEAWAGAAYTGPVRVRVVATDKAGNFTDLVYTYAINQESDRPRIRSNNPELIFNDGEVGYPSTIQTKNIIGTIEDDDGMVGDVYIKVVDSEGAGDWESVSMSGTSFTYTVDQTDGAKTLYFRITDAKETPFKTFETGDTGDILPPKFEWGPVATPQFAYPAREFSIDVTSPTKMPQVYVNRAGGTNFTEAPGAPRAVELVPNMPFGGTSSEFVLWVGGADANGIESIEVTVPGAKTVGALEEPSETQVLTNAHRDDTTGITNFTVFRSTAFDVSGIMPAVGEESVTLTVDIKIKDTTGLTAFDSKVILVDNVLPEITHNYPANGTEQVFGNLTITGGVSDGGSGLPSSAVTYQIGYDYDSDDASPAWKTAATSGATWSILDFETVAKGGAGDRIETYTRKEVTAVDTVANTFTVDGHGYANGTKVWVGADELPAELNFATEYYVRDATENTFTLAASSGGPAIDITTTGDESLGVSSRAESATGNIWYLPVIVRAYDKAGNKIVTLVEDYRIMVDPSGDKPIAYILDPIPNTANDENKPIVGGTIRISGWADDNVAVAAVYMQIDVDGDGDFTAADIDSEGINWFNGGNGKQASGGRNWSMTINESGEFNPEVIGGDEIESGVVYKIEALGSSVDWTGLGAEASPTVGDTFTAARDGSAADSSAQVKPVQRLIMYRVRAEDNGGIFGSWSEPNYFLIDEGVPIFDSLKFEQAGKQRLYEPDMWLSGDWDLTGTVADESNIYSITIGNTTGADNSQITGSLAGNSAWFASNPNINGLAGYDMTIPIRTSTFLTDRTSNSFTITAEDGSEEHIPVSREIRINYDNVAPDISTAYGGATPIQNSNGTYELSSTVEEAQSGFDRVMVVFHRPSSIMLQGGRVYNPLYGTGAAENYIPWGSLTESPEGLPLRAYTGATRGTSTTSLTHAVASADPYARKGYYLRIGGIYHRITDVTGTTITWEGDADISITDFELVYAIAVDNLNTESASVDDGDGIREAVERSVSNYTWRCAIDSTNLPDGQMNIRYVAFDKAGNFARHDDIVTHVENNPPLLAQVRLATNLDGSSAITENEWNPPYTTLVDGVEQKQKTFTVDASPTSVKPFTAKDFMNVDIDIVGGNGALHYTLGLKNGATVTPVAGHVGQSLGTGGAAQSAATTSIIEITLAQLQLMGDGARNFVFSIWDSTETYDVGDSDDFKAELTVTLTVDVVDETAPVTVISPFFWNDVDDNSLYGNSRDNGHIELGTEPKVSGQISIRGTAYDDQRLTALWMYVGDTAATGNFDFPRTAPAPATESKTIYGKTYYKMATYTPGSGWTPTPSVMNENGWVFSVDDEYLDQTGHLVSWQLDWDTADIDGIAAVDRYVRIVAEDKRTNPNPNPSLETLVDNPGDVTTNNVPYYRMDVVPYVQEVVTGLSSGTQANSSIYNRTALGKYPVQENEDIEIKGFNFNGTATKITINGTPLDTPSVIDSNPTKHLGLNIGTSADSGELVVTVGTVESLNNVNDNSQEYNKLPNLQNNDTLTDDVLIDVWGIQDAAAPRDGGIIHPEMEIGPSGEVGFAFVNGNFYFNMAGPANAGETFSATGTNTWASQRAYEKEYAQYWESAFAFDGDGNTYGMSTNIDVYLSGTGNFSAYTSFYFGRRAGNNPNSGNSGWNTTPGNYMGGLYRRRLQSTTSSVNGGIPDTNPNRALSPALATSTHGTRTNVYMAYYDAVRKEIRYRYGSVGRVWERRITNDATAGANTRLTSAGHGFAIGDLVSFTKSRDSYLPPEAQLATYEVLSADANTFTVAGNLTGWIDGNTYASAIGGQLMDATGGWSSKQGVQAGSGTTDQSVLASMYTVVAGPGSSGKYVDVGVVPGATALDDVAVIVWFDAAARALKYGYCTNPQQDDAVFSVSTIDAAGGWYPRIKVDANNGIHIAYYGTSGADLKYAYATGPGASFTTVTVDSYQLVGTQVTLDVAKDTAGNVVPYIGYYSPSAQTAKVAYPVSFTDGKPTKAGVANDKYTGFWEVSNVPTNTITPKDDTVCVGVHKDWTTGVLSSIASSVGTLTDPGADNNIPSRTAGNGSKNPAIAFVDEYDASLKMAQKKGD